MERYRVVRFLVAGSLSALVHIGTFATLTSLLGVWYLYATIAAFLMGTTTSFVIQKFWTFRDTRMTPIAGQAVQYLSAAMFNLIFNFVIYVRTC